MRPRFLERHRLAAQPLGDGAGALLRAVGNQGDQDALIAETVRRELGHVTRAEDERAAAGEVTKDLARDGDPRRSGGRRSRAEPRFGAHAGPDVERRLKQPMQHGTGLRARCFPGLPHLSLDLRLAEDHRIEARRYAVEMADRITVAGDVTVLPRAACHGRGATGWKPLPQQCPHGLKRRLVVGDQIELGAIAGGEQDAATGARRHHARQCARHLVRAMGEPLAHVERRGAVVHS